MSTVVPAFGRAVVAHREAASHLAAAHALMAAGRLANPEAMSTHNAGLQKLATQLAAQRENLTRLAGQMQIAQPGFEGIPPSNVSDIAQAITRANDSASLAEEQIGQASKEVMPTLFPTIAPTTRALIVYIGWALLFWLVQCGLLIGTNGTNAGAIVLSLCGMPVLAFGSSLATLMVLGQPRVGPKHKYSPKLGAIICLLGMPVAWILLIVVLANLR